MGFLGWLRKQNRFSDLTSILKAGFRLCLFLCYTIYCMSGIIPNSSTIKVLTQEAEIFNTT